MFADGHFPRQTVLILRISRTSRSTPILVFSLESGLVTRATHIHDATSQG